MYRFAKMVSLGGGFMLSFFCASFFSALCHLHYFALQTVVIAE
jgi:hypothetical protein